MASSRDSDRGSAKRGSGDRLLDMPQAWRVAWAPARLRSRSAGVDRDRHAIVGKRLDCSYHSAHRAPRADLRVLDELVRRRFHVEASQGRWLLGRQGSDACARETRSGRVARRGHCCRIRRAGTSLFDRCSELARASGLFRLCGCGRFPEPLLVSVPTMLSVMPERESSHEPHPRAHRRARLRR